MLYLGFDQHTRFISFFHGRIHALTLLDVDLELLLNLVQPELAVVDTSTELIILGIGYVVVVYLHRCDSLLLESRLWLGVDLWCLLVRDFYFIVFFIISIDFLTKFNYPRLSRRLWLFWSWFGCFLLLSYRILFLMKNHKARIEFI